MRPCTCTATHAPRRIVLTGGPGAGKTAVLESVRHALCRHVRILPEAAGIVFGGGFPRGGDVPARQAAQRAIYYVQRELENLALAAQPAIVLCDRGTVDGCAYWPGPGPMWPAVGSTWEVELQRYDAVIHLRTPPDGAGYNHANPLRRETPEEARAIDERIVEAWSAHPRRFTVAATPEFVDKLARVLVILRDEVPACCRAAGVAVGGPPGG